MDVAVQCALPGPAGRVSQILTPLELLDRLAMLIPPTRRHRHRYYGVLAPNSPLRAAEISISRAARYVWTMLLARIYEVLPLTCPKCGGAMRIIAFMAQGHAVNDPAEVKKILAHQGEPTDAPRLALARGPLLWEVAGEDGVDPMAQPVPAFEFDQRIAW